MLLANWRLKFASFISLLTTLMLEDVVDYTRIKGGFVTTVCLLTYFIGETIAVYRRMNVYRSIRLMLPEDTLRWNKLLRGEPIAGWRFVNRYEIVDYLTDPEEIRMAALRDTVDDPAWPYSSFVHYVESDGVLIRLWQRSLLNGRRQLLAHFFVGLHSMFQACRCQLFYSGGVLLVVHSRHHPHDEFEVELVQLFSYRLSDGRTFRSVLYAGLLAQIPYGYRVLDATFDQRGIPRSLTWLGRWDAKMRLTIASETVDPVANGRRTIAERLTDFCRRVLFDDRSLTFDLGRRRIVHEIYMNVPSNGQIFGFVPVSWCKFYGFATANLTQGPMLTWLVYDAMSSRYISDHSLRNVMQQAHPMQLLSFRYLGALPYSLRTPPLLLTDDEALICLNGNILRLRHNVPSLKITCLEFIHKLSRRNAWTSSQWLDATGIRLPGHFDD